MNNSAPASPAAASKEPAPLDPILERLRAARAVQLIGHVRPDGDCIGSMLAMHHLLGQWGIARAMAAQEMPTNGYGALEGFDLIQHEPDPALNPDLVVYVDCATRDRGFSNWTPPAPIINIDHHGSNSRYGAINWVDPACAATGEMIFELVEHARASLTVPMAEALLVAITTDTGSFRFSNTGPRQHIVAARLIEAGASVERISRIVYGSHPAESAWLTGHVLSTMRLECGGQLAWSEIGQDVYQRHGGAGNAPENLADLLRGVRGVKVSLLFHEMDDGALRLNLRSNGDVDVGRIAALWGGGGHPCAAGVYLAHADYEKDRERLLQAVMQMISTGDYTSCPPVPSAANPIPRKE
jgi:phosphoesterase RecJ-like protein